MDILILINILLGLASTSFSLNDTSSVCDIEDEGMWSQLLEEWATRKGRTARIMALPPTKGYYVVDRSDPFDEWAQMVPPPPPSPGKIVNRPVKPTKDKPTKLQKPVIQKPQNNVNPQKYQPSTSGNPDQGYPPGPPGHYYPPSSSSGPYYPPLNQNQIPIPTYPPNQSYPPLNTNYQSPHPYPQPNQIPSASSNLEPSQNYPPQPYPAQNHQNFNPGHNYPSQPYPIVNNQQFAEKQDKIGQAFVNNNPSERPEKPQYVPIPLEPETSSVSEAPVSITPAPAPQPKPEAAQRREVSETDLYLLGAIEKLVYRADFMEKRLRKVEEMVHFVLAGTNKSPEPCPGNYTRAGKNCYHFSEARYDWKTANLACRKLKSNLLELETKEEEQGLVAHIQTDKALRGFDFWTGGLNPGLLWIWSNSARPVLENQNATTTPIPGEGRCLALSANPARRSYGLKGEDCALKMNYVCEMADKSLSNEIDRISRDLKIGNFTKISNAV